MKKVKFIFFTHFLILFCDRFTSAGRRG